MKVLSLYSYICLLNPFIMSEEQKSIENIRIIKYWIESSDYDFETMQTLFKSKKYAWALFLGHISLEKLLKALYVSKLNNTAPYIHNLYRIAELSKIDVSDEFADWLDMVTTFNINARYDDYKREFYSLCTYDFALLWTERIKTLRQWIKMML